jgi:metallo-beta-lactamase family protein
MKIHFDGAAQTVTGSQHLLEVNGSCILLDCGLYQGKREESYYRNRHFPFDPARVDAVLLSHAHIDHSGNLPNLVKNGFSGPIYATPGTVSLAEIMLRDSAHIHESDAGYLNKKLVKKGKPPIEPLYTIPDAECAIKLFEKREYNTEFEVAPGVKVRFVEAGHILGAAAVVLDIEENGSPFSGARKRLWFSGDIGRNDLPIVRDPVMPQGADYLLMECTYGDKIHREPEEAYEEFSTVVKEAVRRKGKIIVPAFAVGRTQEIVFFLNRMIRDGDIPRIPVFVDSPLAVNASDVFRMYPHYFDEETHEFMKKNGQAALFFDGLTYTRSVDESKAINSMSGPLVIISASGMAETGRILHHLKNNIEDPRNMILIVSWQAPNTLGRRLADQEKTVNIFGEKYRRKAGVVTIGGLSAHAGQDMLLAYAQSTQQTLKKLFLVHGEERGANPLIEKLGALGFRDVLYPQREQEVEI